MLSYVHGCGLTPLLGDTIGESLNRAAAQFDDRDALISCHQNLRYTYGELLHQVNRAARGLLRLGIQRRDRVGIWGPNTAEWMIAQFAAAKVGAILVNVNPSYQLRELEFALTQSGTTVLISARKYRQSDYTEMLAALLPSRIPCLRHLVYLGSDRTAGALAWSDFIAQGDEVEDTVLAARERELQFDDPVNIQYTSGTTGLPKGATLSHHNILNNGFFVGEALRYTEADRICVAVPFYHCFGCVMANLAAVTHGATVVLPAESFDPEATLRAIETHQCTSIYGVPTMFIAQLEHPSFGQRRLDSLRTGIMAGAPCPIDVMKQVMDRMHVREITICYGMTETSPVSFQSAVDDAIEVRVSTVGRIHPHLECKVIDPATGEVVPRGSPGELCTRGYSVMLGYWENDEATAKSIDAAKWMHTGDLAVMRDDGYVNISGRLKDMIIRGGENVYPREIEEFLYSHPKVSEVQVIGVPDLKYGEEICAWVRLREGEAATDDELRGYCRGQIAHYKIPRYIRFTTDFPTTVTGKIQKFKMREISIEELGLSCAEASIRFTDDREFETRGNHLVNQWPQVRHNAELDLCFGVSREQVTHGCDRYRYHVASGNPVASISELERKGRRVELVSEQSTVPNPIQPSCLYRVQPLRSAGSQKRRPLMSNGLTDPTARTWAITRKPITGRVVLINRPNQRLTFIGGCDNMRPKQRDRRIF